MRTRVLSSALVALVAVTLIAPAAASAMRPGATSLGDPLFPQIGNGGYDVADYALDLRYDPATNALETGTQATITATSTQGLSRFSLDFQRTLKVSAVTVNGQPAAFGQRDAKPRFSANPKVTQPAKLIVTPAGGIPEGQTFVTEVAYSGTPKPIVDADESFEGWIRACSAPGECDGSFTVNEPIGAQSWFPCNNYMTDKATMSTSITAPAGFTALGAGELASRLPGPNGTTTWNWIEDDPMATYLASATVGRFDYDQGQTLFEPASGATLPIYGAIDSAGPAKAKAEVRRTVKRIPSMMRFLSERLGPYPFDSIGYVADWVPAVGYALENQTKPHFAGDQKGPLVSDPELLHELAHQWMGNSVTNRTWDEIWFNEGWATFFEVLHASRVNDAAQSPRQFLRAVLQTNPKEFRLAPAEIEDPANLFSGFAVYSRPGAMLEGYREIVGNERFFGFVKELSARHGYGTIGERRFVREAVAAGGLRGSSERRLRRYFGQWLHRNGVPRLTPADFR